VRVVRPFAARVVRQEYAASTVSRMLDALPAAERTAALAGKQSAQAIDPEAYEESAAALYLYRLRRGLDAHLGVVAEVRTEAFLDGQVRGHEAVQPDRVEGLVDHFTSAAVRSELVALLHQPGPGLAAALEATLATGPLIQFTGPDSWEQTVWRVAEASTKRLSKELSRAVHYVADGHHRVAASLSVWEKAGRPKRTGLMCVLYPLDGLDLLAFHRRVIGPVRGADLLALMGHAFDVHEIAQPEESAGCFALYVEGRWYDAAHSGSRPEGASGLDVTLLNDLVLEPLLGSAAQAAPRLQIAAAPSPQADLTEACDADGGALFVLRPPSLDQLTDVADRGEVMPPKTTYFDPKPYAGIFLR
jgi:uncharacterized protein (DUF1015 family)